MVEEIKVLLALDEDIREYESIDIKAAYNKVWKKATFKSRFRLLFMRYAAIFIVPCLLLNLILGYICVKNRSEPLMYAEICTPLGVIARYELPDRTIVWLNAGSKLRYPTQFREAERKIVLEGEAYFDTSADKEHSFYITTSSGIKVDACGAKFNIAAYKERDFVEVVLEEGKVSVISPKGRGVAVLQPSDKLYYNNETAVMSKEKTSVYENIAWKQMAD